MSRLPTVAVIINVADDPPDPTALGAAGAAALIALADSGLDVLAVIAGGGGDRPARAAARSLGEFGLLDRLTIRPTPLVPRASAGGRPPFTLGYEDDIPPEAGPNRLEPARLPGRDALVFVGTPTMTVPAAGNDDREPGRGPGPTSAIASSWGDRPYFGGVFHPDREGVFQVAPAPALAGPQARWIGEYLRGRYLLPPRSVMLGGAGQTPGGGQFLGRAALGRAAPGRRYLWALARELRRGHARASSAGYPLPVPARTH